MAVSTLANIAGIRWSSPEDDEAEAAQKTEKTSLFEEPNYIKFHRGQAHQAASLIEIQLSVATVLDLIARRTSLGTQLTKVLQIMNNLNWNLTPFKQIISCYTEKWGGAPHDYSLPGRRRGRLHAVLNNCHKRKNP